MQDQITLLTLPAEVRLNIYSFLFEQEWTYIEPCLPTQSQQAKTPLPPLLKTCRLVQQEATPIYYSKLRVHVDVCDSTSPASLINWLHEIGQDNVKLLRHLEMRWDNYADIILDLKRKQSRASHNGTALRPSASSVGVYHRRISALLQQSAAMPPKTQQQQLFFPLLELTAANPTTSERVGTGHTLAIKGVPLATAEPPREYWKVNGTAEFCHMLSNSLSQWLENALARNGGFKSMESVIDFVALTNEHASALRWLGFW